MKKILHNLIILSLLLTGCNEDSFKRLVLETPEDTMKITASGSDIALDENKKDEVALTFTWGDAAYRGEGTELTYYFKMDIANNNFETSIPKKELGSGQRSISFTHAELQQLITEYWNKLPGQTVELEAEVIADVTVYPQYMKPEFTKTTSTVTAYELAVKNLYALGSATGDVPIQLEMISLNKEYLWTGDLRTGTFRIVESRDGEGESDELFTVKQAGRNLIYINLEREFISHAHYPCNNVYMIGNATPAGWDIGAAPAFTWGGYENPELFTWEGELYGGEIKFPVISGEWNPCLMPDAEGNITVPITEKTFILYRGDGTDTKPGGYDAKWNIPEQGNYRITINMNDMMVDFSKQ